MWRKSRRDQLQGRDGAPLKEWETGVHLDFSIAMNQRLLRDLHSSPFLTVASTIIILSLLTIAYWVLGGGGQKPAPLVHWSSHEQELYLRNHTEEASSTADLT